MSHKYSRYANKDYSVSRSAVYNINFHVVIVAKYRKNILNDETFSYVKDKINEVSSHHKVKIKEINHDNNHIHMLISTEPGTDLQGWIKGIKISTSVGLKKYPHVTSMLWGSSIWSHSWFIESVGNVNLDAVTKYIDEQGKKEDKEGTRTKRGKYETVKSRKIKKEN